MYLASQISPVLICFYDPILYALQVKPSQTLRITVLDVDLDDTQGIDHCVEYVSIFSPQSRVNHNTECGKIDEQKIIEIDNNIVEIWFHSSENKTQDKRGFQLEFAGTNNYIFILFCFFRKFQADTFSLQFWMQSY